MVSPCSGCRGGSWAIMAGERGRYCSVGVSSQYSQLRLYSRDLELSNQNVLHREPLASPVVILSLVDNSLLVYMTDNTLLHYLIAPTADTIRLHLAGSISFDGVIANPNAVRVLSWMIPTAQKRQSLQEPSTYLMFTFPHYCRTR